MGAHQALKGENWMGSDHKLNIVYFQWFLLIVYYILSASSSHFMRSSYGNSAQIKQPFRDFEWNYVATCLYYSNEFKKNTT